MSFSSKANLVTMEIDNELKGINKNNNKLQFSLHLIEVSKIECQPKYHEIKVKRNYWQFNGYLSYYRQLQIALK